MRGFQGGFIVARLVPSELDSLWLSWWLMALMLRWRRRSRAAAAALLWGFFTDLVVLAHFMGMVGQVAVVTAYSPLVHAEFMSHRFGARRQSGVEVLLPRAAPTPKAPPIGFARAMGTLGAIAQTLLGGASTLGINMPNVAEDQILLIRAAGARPLIILLPPRVQQWPRLAAWSLTEEYVTTCLPAQDWASSQRNRSKAGARMQEGERRRNASTKETKEEEEAGRPFASLAKGA